MRRERGESDAGAWQRAVERSEELDRMSDRSQRMRRDRDACAKMIGSGAERQRTVGHCGDWRRGDRHGRGRGCGGARA